MKKEYKSAIKEIIKVFKYTNKSNPFWNKRVPDMVCNFFRDNGNGPDWIYDNRLNLTEPCCVARTIIVVLESPHIDEFDVFGNPIAPLINDGLFKSKFFSKLPNGILQKANGSVYQVIFVNAIQLQCSLGVPTAYYRDYVFLYYWERLHKDFEERLKSLISICNIELIINCCTVGSHKKTEYLYNYITKQHDEMDKAFNMNFVTKLGINKQVLNGNNYSLKSFVAKSICNAIGSKNIGVISLTHPSSWFK